MAQKHDYSWHCGFGNYVKLGVILDFNDDTLNLYSTERDISFRHTTGSICNEKGELQFYSNGCKIFNFDHELLSEGDSIGSGDEFYDSRCFPSGGLPWRQGIVMLPIDSTKYQMYHQNAMQDDATGGPFVDVVYRTVIDMNRNNGKGRVVEKNSIVLSDEIVSGNFATVRHANGRDWWMLLHQTDSDHFHIFQIDTSGIILRKEQAIGQATRIENQTIGQAKFTPDGKKFIYYDLITGLQVFDFNRGTGVLSNAIHVPYWREWPFNSKVGGMAISPDSRYVYACNSVVLDQFDLHAEDFETSQVFIDSFDGYADPFPLYFFQMQLAPNNKIYMSMSNGVPFMHVINNPNSAGTACDFVQRGLELPYDNVFSMPYFPNYRLGADSSLLVSIRERNNKSIDFKILPNPVIDELTVDIDEHSKINSLSVFDLQGRQILHREINFMHLDVRSLLSGVYILTIHLEDGRISSRLLVKE